MSAQADDDGLCELMKSRQTEQTYCAAFVSLADGQTDAEAAAAIAKGRAMLL